MSDTPSSRDPQFVESIKQRILDDNPDALFLDGFDDAIVGVARRCSQPSLVVYDESRCIDVLIGQGMSEEEAWDYLFVNIVGAWMGPNTPLVMSSPTDE